MQEDKVSKYEGNPLGLPPSLLDLCETLGRAFVKAIQERDQRQQESQIEDIDYEVINTKQLIE